MARGAEPAFLIDPVLLDVAGQLLGTWHSDIKPDMICFPARIDAIDLYAPPCPEGVRLDAAVLVAHHGGGFLGGEIRLAGAGRLVVTCTGWVDRTFAMPRTTAGFWLDPSLHHLARTATSPGGSGNHWQLDAGELGAGFFTTGGGIWVRTTLRCLLGAEEHQLFEQAGFGAARRDEWLLGRIAAKDAVRAYVRTRTGKTIAPAEITVVNDPEGRPHVRFLVPVGIDPPNLSIAHSGGRAVAAVAEAGEGIGIDIEPADRVDKVDPAFWSTLLGAELSARLPEADRDLWRLRLWCAREAAAKAMGRGLGSGLLRMQVLNYVPETGVVQVGSGDDDAASLSVATSVQAGWVSATCRIRQNQQERSKLK
jgi:phosphopantetheinyl transferase